MTRITALLLVVALLPTMVFAATVEYKGPNGNLNAPSQWYVITDAGNPGSTTGATGLPTLSDVAFLRNSTTTTLNSAFSALNLSVGGPSKTGVATQGATVLDIVAGADLNVQSALVGEEVIDGMMWISSAYPATVNIKGGVLNFATRGDAGIQVGGAPGVVGQLNISGGSTHIAWGPSEAGVPSFNIGQNGSTGKVLMTGGTVRMLGAMAASTYQSIGRSSSTSVGKGEFEITGGLFTSQGLFRVGHDGGGQGGQGTAIISGTGQLMYGYRAICGENNSWGHIKVTGGTLGNSDVGYGDLWLGRGAAASGAPAYTGCGKLTLNQSATLNLHGFFMGLNGANTADRTWMEAKVGSAANFNFTNRGSQDLAGKLEISLTNGYTPTVGQEWLLIDAASTVAAFAQVSAGFTTTVRDGNLYLICTGIRHPGDANNDGHVNVGDLGILAGNWGGANARTNFFGATWEQGDYNGDDVVNVGDLGILAGAWGWNGTPAAASIVPEPASLTLLVLSGLAMLRRRR